MTPINPVSKKGHIRAEVARKLMAEVEKGELRVLIARSADYKHSHTYTPDAAKGTALLGDDEKAYQQVWHLPTAKKPLTGRQWINTFADSMGTESKFFVVSKSMVRLLAIFNPIMREFVEMLYQYDRDYVFDSSKFEKYYHFEPTSYHDGIKAIVNP